MGLTGLFSGTVRLELTSADPAGALHRINDMGIPVWDVARIGELTVVFTATRRNYPKITKMAERKGEQLRILKRWGLFWPVSGLRHRPVLVAGMVVLLAMALFTPSRVLFVRVEGNSVVPAAQILEAAQDAGIRFGASRRAVRSEKMKNALLGLLPQLQWAGVNTYGCTAVISVRERAADPQEKESYAVSSIVASCDGVITSCTVTSGSGLCTVGQAVQEGQVLISGYSDCGLTIEAGRAEGEIFAQTQHDFRAATPAESLSRGGILRKQLKFSLQFGKKRINFWKGSGIYDGSCVKMYEQYHLTLPGGYRLPLSLTKETILYCEVQPQQRSEEDAMWLLSSFAKSYLRSQLVALTILDTQEELTGDQGVYVLQGRYACTEMIGREQCEQIGDFHGKTD